MLLRRLLLSLVVLVVVGVAVQPVLAAVDARSPQLAETPFLNAAPVAIEPIVVPVANAVIGSRSESRVVLPAGSFRLAAQLDGSRRLARQLVLEVRREGRVLASGPLAAFRGVELAGGATLTLRLSLPTTGSDAGDNELQGLGARASFVLAAA